MTGTLMCNRVEDVCSIASIAIPCLSYGDKKFLRANLEVFRREHVIMRKKADVLGLALPPYTLERVIRPMADWENVAYRARLTGSVRPAYENLMRALSSGNPRDIKRAFDVYNGSIRVLGMVTLHPELGRLTEAKKAHVDPVPIYENMIGNPSSKMSLIMGAIRSVGSKVVVASSSVVFLELMEYWGRRHGLRGAIYDGRKTSKQRSMLIGSYMSGGLDVLYISIGACSVSVNLVGTMHMILCDTCLNPSLELQTVGRCHRIGMTLPLRVYRVEMRGTLDEVLVDMVHERKRSNMRVLEGGGEFQELRGLYPLLVGY
jgi:SNF2 family DNA or RNA helicase